jgi:hypothetical protein
MSELNQTSEPEAPVETGETPEFPDAAQRSAAAVDALEELIARLEVAAEQLRSGDLSTDAAATLVEECAVLANRAGTELERRMHEPARGQGTLL